VQDYGKGTCLHVQGGASADGAWLFPAGSKHNVVTQPCASAASAAAAARFDNQAWAWRAPHLTHLASGLNLGVAAPTLALIQDGTYATLAPPVSAADADAPGAQLQAWTWESYATMQLAAAPSFSLTDARADVADADSLPGLPVHLWQLPQASLPSGIPNANWAQLCVPRA
jgi:hypothetical protein